MGFIAFKGGVRRYLEDDNSVEDDSVRWRVKSGAPETAGGNLVSRPRSSDFRSLVGYDIPHFYRKIREGKILPHTPFDQFEVSGSESGSYNVQAPDGWTYYFDNGYPRFNDWVISVDDVSPLAPTPQDMEQMVQCAAARIQSKGHDTLTFLAELRDVRRMFTKMLKRISSSAKRPPKAKRRAAKSIDEAANLWLEARYGWRPLISDLNNLYKALVEFDDSRKRYSERCGRSYSITDYTDQAVNFSSSDLTRTVTDVFNISLRGSVSADIQPPRLQFNPVATGWELVPYSFVLDWIVNVGQAIDSASFLANSANYSASAGYAVTLTRDYSLNLNSFNTGYSGTIWQTGTSIATLTRRKPLRVSPTPYVNVRLDGTKVMDLVALVYQRLK